MPATDESVRTDLNTMEFWAQPRSEHHRTFKWLRANRPISWNDAPEAIDPTLDNAKGFWSVAKHHHIHEVSRNPQLFSSAEGVFIDDFPQLETMLSFIVTDPPRHTEMRNIVDVASRPATSTEWSTRSTASWKRSSTTWHPGARATCAN